MAFSTSTNEGVSGHSPPRPPSPLVPTSLGDMDQDPLSTTEILDTCGLEVDNSGKSHLDHLSRSLSDSSFLQTLDHLLLAAVQQERRLSHGATRSATLRNALAPSVAGCAAKEMSRLGTGTKEMSRLGTHTRRSTDRPDKDLEPLVCSTRAARCAYTQSSVSRKRLRSRSLRPAAADCDHDHPSCFSVAHKKRKHYGSQPRLSGKGSLRRSVANPPVLGLSGAFNLCYAKGPGSLRRAESLRTEFPNGAAEEVVVLNEVVEHSSTPLRVSKYSELSKAFFPQELPIVVGSLASPDAANAPTEPTTPTSTDQDSSAPQTLSLAGLPLVCPPLFELISRAPLSPEDAAERRILAMLEREKDDRDTQGLRSNPPRVLPRPEDEEERFWMSTLDLPRHEHEPEMEDEENATVSHNSSQGNNFNRALIITTPIELNLDSRVFEEVMQWFLEVMPPEEELITSYTPGDLFDLLSTSSETRFHAGHLFMRYFHLVSGTDEDEEPDALEAVTWDLAVACLALSVKFHRDVLFPLDVIYAQEFLNLAPHAMDFADLENAQRDVLEALSYRVGSATPGAFIEELWEALPTLRRLVGFDGGWDGVKAKAWDVLCEALQQQDLLRFPISLLTAAAIIEGVLDVLVKRYKSTGRDSRGKPCKRDSASSRKAAMKCSHGVRLDVQEVLQISNEELVKCQKWLGVFVEQK